MTDYKFWLPLVVSFGAFLFTFLNFRRSKRFENENHIYKLKVEIYSKIIAELVKLIDELQANIIDAKNYMEHQDEDMFMKLNESADKIDKISFSFDTFLVSNSLVIPEKVLSRLNKFSTLLLETDPIETAD